MAPARAQAKLRGEPPRHGGTKQLAARSPWRRAVLGLEDNAGSTAPSHEDSPLAQDAHPLREIFIADNSSSAVLNRLGFNEHYFFKNQFK